VADRLILVGMMGAGKSTIGCAVAAALGWPFHDTDDQVERSTGCSVPELFAGAGEAEFRACERRALLDLAASPTPAVVSVGGGAVLDPRNRAMVREAGTVVWLRARPDTLARRVDDGAGRPLLSGDPSGDPVRAIVRLTAERRALYEEVADVVLDTDDRQPGEVVDEIVSLWRNRR
jgi:shikimate kinase